MELHRGGKKEEPLCSGGGRQLRCRQAVHRLALGRLSIVSSLLGLCVVAMFLAPSCLHHRSSLFLPVSAVTLDRPASSTTDAAMATTPSLCDAAGGPAAATLFPTSDRLGAAFAAPLLPTNLSGEELLQQLRERHKEEEALLASAIEEQKKVQGMSEGDRELYLAELQKEQEKWEEEQLRLLEEEAAKLQQQQGAEDKQQQQQSDQGPLYSVVDENGSEVVVDEKSLRSELEAGNFEVVDDAGNVAKDVETAMKAIGRQRDLMEQLQEKEETRQLLNDEVIAMMEKAGGDGRAVEADRAVVAPKHLVIQDPNSSRQLTVFFHNQSFEEDSTCSTPHHLVPCASLDGNPADCTAHPRCMYFATDAEATGAQASSDESSSGQCRLAPSFVKMMGQGENCDLLSSGGLSMDEHAALEADVSREVSALVPLSDERKQQLLGELNPSQAASLATDVCDSLQLLDNAYASPSSSFSPVDEATETPSSANVAEELTAASLGFTAASGLAAAAAPHCAAPPCARSQENSKTGIRPLLSQRRGSVIAGGRVGGAAASAAEASSAPFGRIGTVGSSSPRVVSPTQFLTMALRSASSSSSAAADAAIRIGLNGFGRIGRLALRVALSRPNVSVKHINCSMTPEYMAYMLKYDSAHGKLQADVYPEDNAIVINGDRITLSNTRDPSEIPWKSAGVDYVCETTGAFCTTEACNAHVDRHDGAKRAVISAPAKDEATPTLVVGVNAESDYDPASMRVVSCASCTTNGLAPLVKILDDKFGLEEGLMTTVHAATGTQKVVDSNSKKDWRGGRSASANIIPASTGAAKAVAKCLPQLKGKLTGMAFRVPTIDVSVVDLTCRLRDATTYEAIKGAVKEAAEGSMKGIVGYTEEPLVSQDFLGEKCSTVFDANAGMMLNPHFVKLVSWYDNEVGYSNRLVDLVATMAAKDGVVPPGTGMKSSEATIQQHQQQATAVTA